MSCLSGSKKRQQQTRRVVHFTGSGGSRLAGVALGRGPIGVVLAHQSPGSLCQWWPYAPRLAGLGYRVLAFDFDGYGASTRGAADYPVDVMAATRWLRDHGTRTVALMGASMGGTAVVVAAARLQVPPVGVIDLSGPAYYAGMNALWAAPRVHVPMLFAVGAKDGGFPTAIRQVRHAAGSSYTPLVTVADNTHGAALVDPVVGYAKVRSAVRRFLNTVTASR